MKRRQSKRALAAGVPCVRPPQAEASRGRPRPPRFRRFEAMPPPADIVAEIMRGIALEIIASQERRVTVMVFGEAVDVKTFAGTR